MTLGKVQKEIKKYTDRKRAEVDEYRVGVSQMVTYLVCD